MTIKVLTWEDDGYCFFASGGHHDKSSFLLQAKPVIARELGIDVEPPEESDVEYLWFRMMSPSEARQRGYDFGYLKTDAPQERKRGGPFPVTAVML